MNTNNDLINELQDFMFNEENIKSYDFKVNAFRTLTPSYISDTVTFSLNSKRSINEEIIWNTDQNLGFIDNGQVSELFVHATNTYGKELEYSLIYNPYRKTPQGLKFLSSGNFIGRVSFRFFLSNTVIARFVRSTHIVLWII